MIKESLSTVFSFYVLICEVLLCIVVICDVGNL